MQLNKETKPIKCSFFLSISDNAFLSVYLCVYGETVDLGKSDKMRKIRVKVVEPNTDNGFNNNISSLFRGILFKGKDNISLINPLSVFG